jgi:hypothetical protein
MTAKETTMADDPQKPPTVMSMPDSPVMIADFQRRETSRLSPGFPLVHESVLELLIMAIYVRLAQQTVQGSAPLAGNIEQVYSPDDATVFSYDDAHLFRQKAFESWPNHYWAMEKIANDKHRVMART